MRPLLPVHIVAGGLAIILGGIALAVAKGGSIHRKSGVLFVYAMVTMGSSAVLMALRSGAIGNVMAGLTAMYFAVTALTTVRPASAWSKRVDIGFMTLAFALGAVDLVYAAKALAGGHLM